MKPPTTFPGGCAAKKLERTEAPGKPPPGVCRSGVTFSPQTHVELVGLVLDLGARLERLERLHRADIAAAIALQRKPTPHDKMQALVALVAEHTGVSVADIMGCRRFESIARARMLAYYVHHEVTALPVAEIARWWKLDRVTVLNGCRRTSDRIETEPAARAMVADLLESAARLWKRQTVKSVPNAPGEPLPPE